MKELEQLALLISKWNDIGNQIAEVIDRPAQFGHIAEFIASKIFEIELLDSASHKGIDGHFMNGPLTKKSVNIKYTAKNDGLIDLTLDDPPDYYLVLSGPNESPTSSRGKTRPFAITSVFLFENENLIQSLENRGVKIGTASSIIKAQWQNAEIYPSQANSTYQLSQHQINMVSLFDLNKSIHDIQ